LGQRLPDNQNCNREADVLDKMLDLLNRFRHGVFSQAGKAGTKQEKSKAMERGSNLILTD
jgi:hypothetical protein